MNGDQARAVLPVLRKYDTSGMTFASAMRNMQRSFSEAAKRWAELLRPLTETMRKVAEYDAKVAEVRRQQMIYGRLDGRRPKR